MPSLSPETWARIRYEYERTARPIDDICAAHGISAGTLRDRMRRWGWRRRRGPVPREGPAAMTVALLAGPPRTSMTLPAGSDHPTPTVFADAQTVDPPHTIMCPDARKRGPDGEGINLSAAALTAGGLDSAAARLAPAIDTAIARLAVATAPRELEQSARALTALLRTLRELKALAAAAPPPATATTGDDDDPVPEDIDEFRRELARRIDAFIAANPASDGDDGA